MSNLPRIGLLVTVPCQYLCRFIYCYQRSKTLYTTMLNIPCTVPLIQNSFGLRRHPSSTTSNLRGTHVIHPPIPSSRQSRSRPDLDFKLRLLVTHLSKVESQLKDMSILSIRQTSENEQEHPRNPYRTHFMITVILFLWFCDWYCGYLVFGPRFVQSRTNVV